MWYVYGSFMTCFYPVGFVYHIDLLASSFSSELFVGTAPVDYSSGD